MLAVQAIKDYRLLEDSSSDKWRRFQSTSRRVKTYECAVQLARSGSYGVYCDGEGAVAVARGQFRSPGRGTSAVGSRHQRTDKEIADIGD
jgi:hypothetical protein